jgi:hypothetical protein
MKLIINNNSKIISDVMALNMVGDIVADGRISNDGKNYCYGTLVQYGDRKIAISSTKNKNSDRFDVWDYPIKKINK